VAAGRPIAGGVGSWASRRPGTGTDPQTPPGGSRHALPVGAGRSRHSLRSRNAAPTGEHPTLGTGSHRVLDPSPATGPTNGNGWPAGPADSATDRNPNADETGGQL
jgi:hypothetical protein